MPGVEFAPLDPPGAAGTNVPVRDAVLALLHEHTETPGLR